jgi:hypothetical protein
MASPRFKCAFGEPFEALGEINMLTSLLSSSKLMLGYWVLYGASAKTASAYRDPQSAAKTKK